MKPSLKKMIVAAGILTGGLMTGAAYAGEFIRTSSAIPGSYIVVLRDAGSAGAARPSAAKAAQQLASKYAVSSKHIYQHAISGF